MTSGIRAAVRLRDAVLLSAVLLLNACSGSQDYYVGGLQRLEPAPARDGGSAGPVSRIDELKREISRFQDIVDRKVEANGSLGTYYKMLALRYVDERMYGEAYRSLQEAIRIYPENPVLFELSGACAGRMARASMAAEERDSWLNRSEAHYLRAIDLDPGYVDALYGLAVLRVFELDRPGEAEGLVERILAKERQNIEAMFLKGQILYRTGRLREAVEVYERIAGQTRVEDRRREAERNRQRIEEELGGR